jgi:hypothetical protein
MRFGSAALWSLFSVLSRVFILFGVWGNARQELRETGIREPELTLQVLSGMGGVGAS